jgi:putative flippase GtrA
MAKTQSKNRRLLIQAAEYMISGGAYFWAGYALFTYLYYAQGWSLWWATIVSNVFGWSINFILQRYWVFKNPHLKNKLANVTTRYIIITLIDFALNYLILYQLRVWGITPAIGQFISAGFFTVWNYFWYRYWVFPARLPAPRHPAIRVTRTGK